MSNNLFIKSVVLNVQVFHVTYNNSLVQRCEVPAVEEEMIHTCIKFQSYTPETKKFEQLMQHIFNYYNCTTNCIEK